MYKFLAVGFVGLAQGDVYMHMPKGSNNRLNEKSANRNNGNRLFDSQNNNRGGYNKGDLATGAFGAGGGAGTGDVPFANEYADDQYSEVFFEGSVVPVEWTNQHGCGGHEKDDPHKLNCNMVIQYSCNTDQSTPDGLDKFDKVTIMDGRNTDTPDAATGVNNFAQRNAQNNAAGFGRHENEGWYYQCEHRERNKGLFTADQNLKGSSAKYTRQNPNGNRRGLECPEERDYYPYWWPSPFVDVAYLTDEPLDCDPPSATNPHSPNIKAESQNVKDKFKCVSSSTDDNAAKAAMDIKDETACTALGAGYEWKGFSWKVAAPVCQQGEWSRVNHLGNGRNGQPVSYNWTVPLIAELGAGIATATKTDNGGTTTLAKCFLRLRYNISTDDYDVRKINASSNSDNNYPYKSPVTNNPTVNAGLKSMQGLKLAINTAQFGRTFQDRTHSFYIRSRPALVAANTKVHNLQVRGKRGNIVQTFPSVEYDFAPNNLEIKADDVIHLQWTGSNTHNNGNPAGDGQAGDAGEGTGGTDRNNFVSTLSKGTNYPLPYGKGVNEADLKAYSDKLADMRGVQVGEKFTKGFDCWAPVGQASLTRAQDDKKYMSGNYEKIDDTDCAVWLATGGYIKKAAHIKDLTNGDELSVTLDNAPASLQGGMILKPKTGAKAKKGYYNYMGSRNNNFSNRSQKGVLKII